MRSLYEFALTQRTIVIVLTFDARSRSRLLKSIPIIVAAWIVGTTVCSAANAERVEDQTFALRPDAVAVRTIGTLRSGIATRIFRHVRSVPFTLRQDSPVLLQGETVMQLKAAQTQEIKATYRAGHTIMLLGATMQHIKALHAIVEEGVSYRAKDTAAATVMAYALRREGYTPTAILLARLDSSPLETPGGGRDLTGVLDEQLALSRAVARAVAELTHAPRVGAPGPLRDPNQPVDWLSAPTQATTFAINSPQGVYNTSINVYALYRCLDQTDHYAVTAQADWTATNAQWQGATSYGSNPTMTQDSNGYLVVNWQSNNRDYCASPGAADSWQNVCRYVNYPLSYGLTIVPRTEAPVVQVDAAPAATQGQATTYASGFSFNIGGTVNVNAEGPGGGISAGATWTNTTQTTVPPLIVDVSNTGSKQEGVNWNFKYCTNGLEPDPGTDCTPHVQMVRDVCIAQLGDSSGTNPQQGQTPVGKFSNAVQSARWQADSTKRVGKTFDIEVAFQANLANTISHLNNGSAGYNQDGPYPDQVQGCNGDSCACVSVTTPAPVTQSYTFQIPFSSTKCN